MSYTHPTASRAAAITDDEWNAWLESRPEQRRRPNERGIGAALIANTLHSGLLSSPTTRLAGLALAILGVQTAASIAYGDVDIAMLQLMIPALMLLEGARAWMMASEAQKLKSRGPLDEIAATPGGPESLVSALAHSWRRARNCALIVHGAGMAIIGTALLVSDGNSPYFYLGVLTLAFGTLAIASPALGSPKTADMPHVEDAALVLAPPSVTASVGAACRRTLPLLFIPPLLVVGLLFAAAATIAFVFQFLPLALAIAAVGVIALLGGAVLAGLVVRRVRRNVVVKHAQQNGSLEQQFQKLVEGR